MSWTGSITDKSYGEGDILSPFHQCTVGRFRPIDWFPYSKCSQAQRVATEDVCGVGRWASAFQRQCPPPPWVESVRLLGPQQALPKDKRKYYHEIVEDFPCRKNVRWQ